MILCTIVQLFKKIVDLDGVYCEIFETNNFFKHFYLRNICQKNKQKKYKSGLKTQKKLFLMPNFGNEA